MGDFPLIAVCEYCGEHILVAMIPEGDVQHKDHFAKWELYDDKWREESRKWY